MTTFILILFIKSGYAGGLATAEFNSKAACNAALQTVVNDMDGFTVDVSGFCVEKG